MSTDQMMDQAPLYALDSLGRTELAEFESHLEQCHRCQAEVAVYQAIAANLVYDGEASDATWNRISAAIRSNGDTSAEVVALRPRSGDASRPWRRIASIAAVAALVLAGLLAAQIVAGGQLTGSGIVTAADQAATEPGTIVGDFLVEGVTVAKLVLAEDGQGYVIPTDDLQPLDSSRTYQLWVVNDTSDVISAGVLGADPGPSTFTWTGGVSGFALTREVAGGVVSSAGDVVAVIEEA
ncbi:MAG: anti-sigma factor [Acidimicrobiia bacterium]|jgi:anti-sigma factor RsiW